MVEIGRIRGGGAEAQEVTKEQWHKRRGAKLAGLVEDMQTGFKRGEDDMEDIAHSWGETAAEKRTSVQTKSRCPSQNLGIPISHLTRLAKHLTRRGPRAVGPTD